MAFKQCSIGTKCAKKISPTPLHHHQPEPLRQGRMDPCFHVLYAKFWLKPSECRSRNGGSSDQATFFQSSIVQFWWACVNCILRVLFLSDRSGTRCGLLLLAAHLLQGLMCCVFRDGLLQILVVTSDYLSYCCLSIISNQSAHSPLTSDINKAFSSTQLPLTGYFLFFRPFSVNPRDGCVWKSQ